MPQDGSEGPQGSPKTAEEAPKTPQEAPKKTPKRARRGNKQPIPFGKHTYTFTGSASTASMAA